MLADFTNIDTRSAIQLIVALVVVWLVIGLLFLIPVIPQVGKTIITVVGALVSILVVLKFFGLI